MLKAEDLVLISELSQQAKNVSIYFKVLDISETRTVKVKSTGQQHGVADAIIGDSSGIVILTLWDEWIDELNAGESYLLQRGYVSVYEGSIRLNIGRNGEISKLEKSIEPVNESLNMSNPSIKKKKSRRRSRIGRSLWGKAGREGRGYCSRKEF
jgi:replication factor A1